MAGDRLAGPVGDVAALLGAGQAAEARRLAERTARDWRRTAQDQASLPVLLHSLGTEFLRHQQPKVAVEFLERALDLKQRANAPNESLATTLHNLGACHQLLKQPKKAIRAYQAELKLGATIETLADRFMTMRALAEVLQSAGKADDAALTLRQGAVEAHQLASGLAAQAPQLAASLAAEAISLLSAVDPRHPELGAPLCLYGRLLRDQGELAEAQLAFRRALEIVGRDRRARSAVLNGLGLTAVKLGDRSTGLALLEEALELAGPDAPDQTLSALVNLAQLLDDPPRREAVVRRALNMIEGTAARPLYEPLLLGTLVKLLLEQARTAEATPLVQRLVAATAAGGDETSRIEAAHLQGLVHRLSRRLPEARRCLEEAAARADRMGDADTRAVILADLAMVHIRAGDLVLADAQLRAARALAGDPSVKPATRAVVLNQLATLREETQDLSAAAELYDQALAALAGQPRDDSALRVSVLNNRAGLMRKMDRWEEAVAGFQQVIAARKAAGADGTPSHAEALRNLAGLLEEIGTRTTSPEAPAEPLYAQASALLADARAILEGLGEARTAVYDRVLFGQAFLAAARGAYDQAEHLYGQAIALADQLGIDALPFETKSLQDLSMVYAATGRPGEAFDQLFEGMRRSTRGFEQAFTVSTEAARLDFADRWRGELHALVSLASRHLRASAPHRARALAMVLARKSIVADAALTARLLAGTGDRPQATADTALPLQLTDVSVDAVSAALPPAARWSRSSGTATSRRRPSPRAASGAGARPGTPHSCCPRAIPFRRCWTWETPTRSTPWWTPGGTRSRRAWNRPNRTTRRRSRPRGPCTPPWWRRSGRWRAPGPTC